MLTEKRIKELAVIAEATTPARHARLVNVIRLSVAETAEACAKVCDGLQDEMDEAGRDVDFYTATDCADAIRDGAKGAK